MTTKDETTNNMINHIEDVRIKSRQMSRLYCAEIMRTLDQSPLLIGDLEKAFIAGYESGTLNGLSKDDFMQGIEILQKRMTEFLSDS